MLLTHSAFQPSSKVSSSSSPGKTSSLAKQPYKLPTQRTLDKTRKGRYVDSESSSSEADSETEDDYGRAREKRENQDKVFFPRRGNTVHANGSDSMERASQALDDMRAKIKAFRRLAEQEKPYIAILKEDLIAWETSRHQKVTQSYVRGHLGRHNPIEACSDLRLECRSAAYVKFLQVLEDGQAWYATFKTSDSARKCHMLLDKKPLLGLPIALHVEAAPSHDEVDGLQNELDHAMKGRMATVPSKEREKALDAAPAVQEKDERNGWKDAELVEYAGRIILTELKEAFARDLRWRVVPGKIADIWNKHEEEQASQKVLQDESRKASPEPDARMDTATPKLDEAATALQNPIQPSIPSSIGGSAILKLPSFAKRASTYISEKDSGRHRSDSIASIQLHTSDASTPRQHPPNLATPSLREDAAASTPSSDTTLPTGIISSNPGKEQQKQLPRAITPPSENESLAHDTAERREKKVNGARPLKKEIIFTSSDSEDELDAIVQQLKKKSERKQKERLERQEAKKKKQKKRLSRTPSVVPVSLVEEGTRDIIPSERMSLEPPIAMPTPAPTDTTITSSKRELSADSDGPNKRAKISPLLRENRLEQIAPDSSFLHKSSLDPVTYGLAEDDEDLYYLRLALQRKRAGDEYYPPPRTVEGEEDDEVQELRHDSGSARTEGYYRIPQTEKLSYLASRNQAVVDSSQTVSSSIAVSRLARVNARHLVSGLDKTKKATASDADVLQFNQLRTRKKQLRFARSPIHDWGLYAMEVIPAGEMVIEYVGETIRQQVADKREKAYERQGIGSSYLL